MDRVMSKQRQGGTQRPCTQWHNQRNGRERDSIRDQIQSSTWYLSQYKVAPRVEGWTENVPKEKLSQRMDKLLMARNWTHCVRSGSSIGEPLRRQQRHGKDPTGWALQEMPPLKHASVWNAALFLSSGLHSSSKAERPYEGRIQSRC